MLFGIAIWFSEYQCRFNGIPLKMGPLQDITVYHFNIHSNIDIAIANISISNRMTFSVHNRKCIHHFCMLEAKNVYIYYYHMYYTKKLFLFFMLMFIAHLILYIMFYSIDKGEK